ncbi:MAG: tyrosine-type recombinase/integrase [Chryseolinea sp.]
MTETFFKYLQFEKRLSKHTILSYKNDVNQFSIFLQMQYSVASPEEASYGMIRSWIISMVEEGLQPSSINRKIACLRSLYKFWVKGAVVDKNPMTKVTVLKSKRRLPSFVKISEINQLLDHSDFRDGFDGVRDQLVLEMLYATGIRLNELINLTEKNVDINQCTIKVLGKRNKERVIPFSPNIVKKITAYRELRNREVKMKEHGLLFVTSHGDPCYPMLIYRSVNRHLKTATVAEKKSPHVLRHSYATHLLDRGAEINAVKDLLGHSSLAATQVYTHNTIDKLKKAFDLAHPKA